MEQLPISKAMLMAAGLGTRLRPFTDFKTKALLPVLGIPAAQFAVDSLIAAGVDHIVANVHHDALAAKQGLLSLDRANARMSISDESALLLGSAGGMKKGLSLLGEGPVFLANADTISEVDWRGLALRHQQLRRQWNVSLTLTLFPAGPPGFRYREIKFDSQQGLLTGLGEQMEGRPFFMGAMVLEPEAFSQVSLGEPAEFVPAVLQPAIQKRKAGVFLSAGTWFDMGTPELWRNTHLSMIQQLEGASGSRDLNSLWRKRIESVNRRLNPGVWISRGTPRPPHLASWSAPCYWNSRSGDLKFPVDFGPGAVLYGEPSQESSQSGIGYGGQWIQLS